MWRHGSLSEGSLHESVSHKLNVEMQVRYPALPPKGVYWFGYVVNLLSNLTQWIVAQTSCCVAFENARFAAH